MIKNVQKPVPATETNNLCLPSVKYNFFFWDQQSVSIGTDFPPSIQFSLMN